MATSNKLAYAPHWMRRVLRVIVMVIAVVSLGVGIVFLTPTGRAWTYYLWAAQELG